jgi:hypothetical protein
MEERYHRFIESTTPESPKSSFAVAARHFWPNQGVSWVTSPLTGHHLKDADYKDRWVLSHHFTHFWLLGRGGAPPLQIRFPIPKGRYHATAYVMGDGTLALSKDEEPLNVQGPPVLPSKELACKAASLGWVEIEDDMFRLAMKPLSEESCFLIKHIEFDPPGVEKNQKKGDEDLLERLRTLGY